MLEGNALMFSLARPMTPGARLCPDKGLRIVLDIEEEDIERIAADYQRPCIRLFLGGLTMARLIKGETLTKE